jgi:Ca2+-binding RTX toxin-like protein
LWLERLEDRVLPTTALGDVLNAYDSGASALAQLNTATSIANQALGLNIPLVNESLSSALGIPRDIQAPFQTQPSGPDWPTVQSQLESAGFTVLAPFTGDLDANGNLLKVSWSRTLPAPTALFTASGHTGFSYLDSAAGGLLGAINAQAQDVTFQVALGVDLQNGLPAFYVADSSALRVDNLSGQGSLSGNLSLGSLADIDASATATLTIPSATLTLNNVHGDHKLRAGDFGASGAVRGDVQGSVQLGASFVAHLPLLADLPWSGTFRGTLDNSGFHAGNVSLNEPSPQGLLSSLGQKFFSLGGGIPILGPLASALNQPLPLINEPIGQLTGLNAHLPNLPSLPNLSAGGYSLQLGPGTLQINVTTQAIDALLHGQPVDLVSWTTGRQTVALADFNKTVPIYSFGIPDIASAEIDATFGLHASLNYDVGFGIDTNGFWIKAGSPADPTLGLSFSATAGLQGQVEVFGFPLARAGGNLGFTLTPYVALTAPPYSANPGRVYMSDLQVFGANPVTDFLSALSAGIKGDLTGSVYASIDLFLFSVSWHWGLTIPVFNYVHNPSWPARGSGHDGLDPYPSGPDANGVLTFNGTAFADNVQLKQIAPHTVQLTWAGHGPAHTYSNVNEVDFHGNGGNDRLTTAPGFTIPIRADAASGNAFLQGGDGGNTLVGGSGNDTLVAGKGNDSLVGGSGNNMILGGDGHDVLRAGSGNDQIFGGAGDSSIFGGAGNDSIYGGSGNDTIHGGSGVYFIDGGSGNDVIYGDAGHAPVTIDGVLTYPVIHGGTGNTVIYGGAAPSQIFGDGGSDTIYGGSGNDTLHAGTGGGNVIYGGRGGSVFNGGGDLIFGGTGNDVLYGMGGNNTIYGGTGNETLYGGDGRDLVLNVAGTGLVDAAGDGLASGNNLLIGGPGNHVILYGDSTGHNTLHAGSGSDTLFAGTGGDYLAAGTGVDSLYGGPGDDSIQLEFTPTGQQPDTVVGGPGLNTLVLKGTANNNQITFTQVAGAPNQYQATLFDLDTGAFLGQVNFTMPPDVEQVALEGGPGNNLIQVSPSVTRNMFLYGGPGHNTLMAGSGNDTLVGGPGSSLLYGGTGNDVLYGGDMPSQDTQPLLDSSGTVTSHQLAAGHNTLIAGSGNDELFAGPGGDVLIGGSAILQNGQFVLVPGAGRDVLVGGAGNDLLIAGPGGPGAMLFAGSGNDVLVSDNDGPNVLDGSTGTGTALLLGGNLGNIIRGGAGRDTLVGGLGINYLQAGAGADVLYAYPNPADWAQGEAAAAAHNVRLAPRSNPFQGDPVQLYDQLRSQLTAIGDQTSALLHLQQAQTLTPLQASQLHELLNVDQLLSYERGVVDYVLGANLFVDRLIGGAGTDQLYGGPYATQMVGGTGNDTFYNYHDNDTIQGGNGTNTLMFQGDGTINLQHVVVNGQDAVSVTVNDQQWVVGNIGNISHINVIGVQTLGGNDTVTVNFGQWAGLGVYVQAGGGNVLIDASSFQGHATLLGGSGNDTIKIGTQLATGSMVQGGTGASELDIQGSNGGDQVTVAGGVLTVDGVRESGAGLQKLVVVGGSGTNTFSSDGSIPNVVFVGGSGSNTFTIGRGQYTVVGGTGTNRLIVQGDNHNGNVYRLSQNGSVITLSGGVVSGTATNMTSVTVNGGGGNNDVLDASGMILGVTLDGQGGNSDTVLGGAGNDTLYLTGNGSTYDGGDGTDNRIAIRAAQNHNIVLFTNLVIIDGQLRDVTTRNIEAYQVETGGAPVNVRPGTVADLEHWVDTSHYAWVREANFNLSSQVSAALPSPVDVTFTSVYVGLTPTINIVLTSSSNLQYLETVNVWFHGVTLRLHPTIWFYSPAPVYNAASAVGYVNVYEYLVSGYEDTTLLNHYGLHPVPGIMTVSGSQQIWAMDNPLTLSSLTAQAGTGPVTNLTAAFTDADAQGAASSDRAAINWGDGTTSLGTISALGSGRFSVAASHIYATNEAHPITLTVIDIAGAAVSGTTSYTGGLNLEGNGDLRNYVGTTSTPVDSGVQSFVVRNADSTVFVLHTDGSLVARSGAAQPQVDGGVLGIWLGLDGKLYALHGDGNLYAGGPGSPLTFSESGVRSLTPDASGNLYKLKADGSLSRLPTGSGWVLLPRTARSVSLTADGTAVNVLATDGNYWQYDGSAWTLLAGPHFALSVPGSATAGQALPLTLTVLDAFNNPVSAYTGTVHFTSSDAATGSPPDYTFTTADGGAHTFNITLKTAGSQTITVTAPGASAGASVTVNPGPASFFGVTRVAPTAVAGSAVAVTVTAYDAYGNVATGYTGTVDLSSTDGQAVLPDDYSFTPDDGGAHTFEITLKTAGGQTVTATDAQAGGITGSGAVTVLPAAATSLQVTSTVVSVAGGTTLAVTVTALDAYGNVATGYTGTVHFTSSDALAGLPADYTFTVADPADYAFTETDNGTHVFGVVLGTVGTQSLTVTDAAGHTGTEGGILVTPAAFLVSGFPSSVTAGDEAAFTVTALNADGSVATGYTGTVHFTSSDRQAGLPDDYTFTAADAGVHTFLATLKTAGTQSLTVGDTLTPGQSLGTQADILVTAGDAVALIVSGYPSPVAAQAPNRVTVTAVDAYGNVATGYTGTVHFSSDDPGALLPQDYVFLAGDAGVQQFDVRFGETGTYRLRVMDVALASLAGEQDGIVVL